MDLVVTFVDEGDACGPGDEHRLDLQFVGWLFDTHRLDPEDEGILEQLGLYPGFVVEMTEDMSARNQAMEDVEVEDPGPSLTRPVAPAEVRCWAQAWQRFIGTRPPDVWEHVVRWVIRQGWEPEEWEITTQGTPQRWARWLDDELRKVEEFADQAERAGVRLQAAFDGG